MKFTIYDPNDQTTWPPGDGLDVLVCYLGVAEFNWAISWSSYGPDHEYAIYTGHGTDWENLEIQRSDWVAWRLLDPASDAPDADSARDLRHYYEPRVAS